MQEDNTTEKLYKSAAYTQCICEWEKIISKQNHSIKSSKFAGKAYFALGKIDESIECLKMACGENDPEAFKDLGNCLKLKGVREEAKNAYQKAIEIDPSYAPALNNLIMLKEEGDIEKAIALTREAINIDPLVSSYHANLALALRGNQKYAEAIDANSRALRIEEENHLYHDIQAMLYRETNDIKLEKFHLVRSINLMQKE